MSGYTPDEKLRLQQLRVLRRRWLKDQELSPREPVLPLPRHGPVGRFWQRFLQPGGVWRLQTYKMYNSAISYALQLIIPAWIIHYYAKYHIQEAPNAINEMRPSIFPGDRILETGEIIPPFEEKPTGHD
ncbi:NADH dehydrogenase [ubiquinone] 1 beta subcomplex subunit 6 [Emydura macquarii macquarii]|uniref:NADH dehydrogenase [ubiquinone] 1 beta subcomplex subunit 6 n=1 Tax=Emydura macquarii macquarii TaxID=1129001 RepID=UPI00352B0593